MRSYRKGGRSRKRNYKGTKSKRTYYVSRGGIRL